MFDHILYENKLVASYHEEYLSLINYYHNIQRPSVFVKYYNINYLNSTYEDGLDSTYDIYKVSDIKFDIYDYTPVQFIQAINNRPTNIEDLDGQRMDAGSTIISYTLPRPRHNDLVLFYPPVYSKEIFRVSEITTPVNNLFSKPAVNWAELELSYAPIQNTESLKINNHYIYDLSDEKYIEYNDYIKKVKKLSLFSETLNKLSLHYNKYKDLYIIDNKIPLCVNELLILFKQHYNEKYKRLFENVKSPFGYFSYFKELNYEVLESSPFYDDSNTLFSYYNIDTNLIENYTWVDRDVYNNPYEEVLFNSYKLFMEIQVNGF